MSMISEDDVNPTRAERQFQEDWTGGPRNVLERGGFYSNRFRRYEFTHVRYFGIVLERLVYNWILEVYLWKWQFTWRISSTKGPVK